MIALTVIARNEARCIVRCLESVRPWVDEMVVVDTGSTDATVELARAVGACVLHFDWVDDFSAARNFALAQTDAEWRLVLDADEWLIAGGEGLRAACGAPDGADAMIERFVGLIEVCNEIDEDGTLHVAPSWLPRLLPRGVQYRGRVHEQPEHQLALRSLPVRVGHDGYRVAQWASKRERNRPLLEREIAERPDDAYLHYQLGKDAQMRGDDAAAAQSYARARQLIGYDDGDEDATFALRRRLPWLHALVLGEIGALKRAGRLEEAVLFAQSEMGRWERSPDFYFALGDLLLDYARAEPERATDLLPMIEASWKQAIEIGEQPSLAGTVRGRGSFLAAHNLAGFYESQGLMDRAREYRALEKKALEGEAKPSGNTPARARAGKQAAKQRMKPEAALAAAVRASKDGDLDEAIRLYDEVLRSAPKNFTALTGKGTALLQRGDFEPSLVCFERSLRVDPKQPLAHNNRGTALHQLHRHEDALTAFKAALALAPRYADAAFNCGNALRCLGRFREALDCYDRALAIAPGYANAHRNSAHAHLELGELELALACFDQAVAEMPDDADLRCDRAAALRLAKRDEDAREDFAVAAQRAPHNAAAHSGLGLVEMALRKYEEAVAAFDKALELEPESSENHAHRGFSLMQLNRNDAALVDFDKALALQPDYRAVLVDKAATLRTLGRREEALECCDRVLEREPDCVAALINRGNALQDLNRLDEAFAADSRAIELQPDNPAGHNNRGNVLERLGRFEDARRDYLHALELDPALEETKWNLSLLYLLLGEYEPGWKLYESRWLSGTLKEFARNFPQPLWLGQEDLRGKTILLHAEQGLGDTLQFSRYVSTVCERGGRVLLEVPGPLMRVMKTLPGNFELIAKKSTLPAFDYQCPLMSLPLAFGTTVETIPAPARYLGVDDQLRESWRVRLGPQEKLRVGLVWSGNPNHKNDHNRSVPLETLAPLFALDAEFHCLQKDVRASDLSLASSQPHLRLWSHALGDFSDTAALVSLMDVVISVDTSVAHLAGAIGAPLCVLLPYAPDFRWMIDREDTPWYPNAKLYRQAAVDDWRGALDRLVSDVSERIRAHAASMVEAEAMGTADPVAEAHNKFQIGERAHALGEHASALAWFGQARTLLGCRHGDARAVQAGRDAVPWLHALAVEEVESLGAAHRFGELMDLAPAELSVWVDSPDYHHVLGHALLEFAIAEPGQASDILPMIEASWMHALELGDRPELIGAVAGRGSHLAAHSLAAFHESQGHADRAEQFRAIEHDLMSAHATGRRVDEAVLAQA